MRPSWSKCVSRIRRTTSGSSKSGRLLTRVLASIFLLPNVFFYLDYVLFRFQNALSSSGHLVCRVIGVQRHLETAMLGYF